MSLYTLDIQVPREKSNSVLRLFQTDQGNGFDIISSNILYTDLNSSYYRLEIFSSANDTDQIRTALKADYPDVQFRIREDMSLYERPLVDMQPRQSLEFKKSFMATSPAAVSTVQKYMLPQRSQLRDLKLTQSRIGLFSNGTALEKPHQITVELERDQYLISKHTGIQAFPLWMEAPNEEQFIRAVASLAPNYFALRICGLDNHYALDIPERISNLTDVPLIHAEHAETSTVIAAVVKNAARTHGVEIKEKSAAIIGLSSVGHGLSEALFAMGFARVYGIDADSRQLTRFERTEGIATSLDHVYENADFVIIAPNYPVKLDETRFKEGQIILSFTPDSIDRSNLASEVAGKSYQDHAPHPVFILPGLVAAMQKYDIPCITLDMRLKLIETLQVRDGLDQFLPIPTADLIRSQIQALG